MRVGSAVSDTLETVSGQFEGELLVQLEEGKKQALATLAASKREAKAAVTKILDGSVKQAESLRRQVVGGAELEARNAQLRVLENAVVDVFEKATKELAAIPDARYEKALAVLLKEGSEVLGQKAKVYCRQSDRRAVSSAIGKVEGGQSRMALASEPIETSGGVVMTSEDGSTRFDNTFEARLERMRPTLRMEVSATLSTD